MNFLAAVRISVLLLGITALLSAQPRFEANRVLPSMGGEPQVLAPGRLMSIYGSGLGPQTACIGGADPQRKETPNPRRPDQSLVELQVFPKELCGVKVLVGGVPAGLLYVHDRQINFKVPQETAIEGTVPIQVIYRGIASQAISLPLSTDNVSVSLESPAFVGGPVWLKVNIVGAYRGNIHYPFNTAPFYMPCQSISVSRNGQPLTPLTASLHEPVAFIGTGLLCGHMMLPGTPRHTGRIPLHLLYRFDQPGDYEVRYEYNTLAQRVGGVPLRAPLTRITIGSAASRPRSQWLAEQSAKAPENVTELLSDYLPSILGWPDAESLRLVVPYLHHNNENVRQYVRAGLAYWPVADTVAAVSEALYKRGPSDAVISFLSSKRLDTREAERILETSLPYLTSDSPLLSAGALKAVTALGLAEQPSVSAATRRRAESALIASADRFLNSGNSQTMADFAAALGQCSDSRAGVLLWQMIEKRQASGQAVVALTWRHDPADLPRLVQLTLTPSGEGYEYSNLPYALRKGYGEAALGQLELIAKKSPYGAVRTASARELIEAGRPSGFAELAESIESRRADRLDLMSYIRQRFPEMAKADEAAMLTFAKERAGRR